MVMSGKEHTRLKPESSSKTVLAVPTTLQEEGTNERVQAKGGRVGSLQKSLGP